MTTRWGPLLYARAPSSKVLGGKGAHGVLHDSPWAYRFVEPPQSGLVDGSGPGAQRPHSPAHRQTQLSSQDVGCWCQVRWSTVDLRCGRHSNTGRR